MQIRFHCPTEDCVAIVELEPLQQCGGAIQCPRCRCQHPISVTDAMCRNNRVDTCALCGGEELFVQKDFPQRLGLLIVLVFGAASLYYFSSSIVMGWLILFAAVLIDLVIYAMIGKVTTCYACRAQYRKCNLNPLHDSFDLATSEKY